MSRIESAATVTCRQCGERYARGGYANQHGPASKLRVRHGRFCSPGCRQRAYVQRKRLGASRKNAMKSPESPIIRGCVTSRLEHIDYKGEIQPQKTNLDHRQGLPEGLVRDLRILAPRDIIEAECWGSHSWQSSVSSDGVKIEIARLRPRALAV
jgi:hypothetical protein